MSGSDLVEAKDQGEKNEEETTTSNQITLFNNSLNSSNSLSFEEIETKYGLVPRAYVQLFNYLTTASDSRTFHVPYGGKKLLVLSGAIGVGKSTILYWLDKMQHMPGFDNKHNAIGIAREPWVSDDSKISSEFDLKAFYDNPAKHAARFQFDVLSYYTSITLNLAKTETWKNHERIIVERSPYDVIEVFLPVWRWAMPEAHYNYLLGIASLLCKMHIWDDAHYFYINTSEDQMLERVHGRKREAEVHLADVRLTQVHNAYTQFVSGKWPKFYIFENRNHKDLFHIVTHLLLNTIKE